MRVVHVVRIVSTVLALVFLVVAVLAVLGGLRNLGATVIALFLLSSLIAVVTAAIDLRRGRRQ